MNGAKSVELDSTHRGASPSLVEHFSIEGLYGYRTVSLSSGHAATILIAKNGSGKTTLLGALDVFLKGQFVRLSTLQFSKIRCKLRGSVETLELNQEDVSSLLDLPEDSEVYVSARRHGMEPGALLDFILADYASARKSFRELHESEVFRNLLAKNDFQALETKKLCDRLYESLRGRNQNVEKILNTIRELIGDVEIVYLPTYRRIELPLSEEAQKEDQTGGRRRQRIKSRLGLPTRGFFNTDIQFGLSDIADRLSELNQELLLNSNQGYREISANIINELLDGTVDRAEPANYEKPDRETLLLFFSRLKEGRQNNRFRDNVSLPNVDRIYNEGASSLFSNKFLQFFLGKLNTVIGATRDIEGLVEEFINHCNRYLSEQEPSTAGPRGASPSADNKRLRLDRKTLRVHVESVSANRKIPMDSLSSGEKQMISLFARLYLYKGPKIILIDEPELSLSIDWQRKILVDVVNAPTCSQVIAITHSPFVFDNELEPYARSLTLRVETVGDTSGGEDLEDDLNE